MSIVLFHCPKCGNYSTGAMVNLVVCAILDAKRGLLFPHDISYPENGISLEDIVESRCEECDSPTALVTLNKCPHLWQERGGYPAWRFCAYCGETQKGRMVFDD